MSSVLNKVFAAALSHGGNYAEIYAEQSEVESLELTDGVVSQAAHTLVRGVGIRVLSGERTGYAYVMTPSMTDLLRAAQSAACIADSCGPRAQVACPSQQACPTIGTPGMVDTATEQSMLFSLLFGTCSGPSSPASSLCEENMPIGQVHGGPATLHRLEELAYALDPRVVKVKAVLASTNNNVTIASTLHEPVSDQRQRTALMLHVVMESEGRHEMGFASEQLCLTTGFITEERLERLVRGAVSQADHLFQAVTPQGGDMPVVMAAGASGILLHEAIGHAFEADFNRQGTSIFSDKMGQQICRSNITIVDDATLLQASGSYSFDDEGSAAQCTYLVHEGRLQSYLHDRISAQHYGVEPTGNGRRQSFRHAPVPRMTNTYMLPGEATEEDIIRSVKRGIYAQSFTNGQVQIGAGDFTFFLKTGFLIEDGHLTTPIRDVNIIGNGPRALADISMVGNNLVHDVSAAFCGKAGQQVPVGQGIPTVLVDCLTVGGV